jgi:hypothetical protein
VKPGELIRIVYSGDHAIAAEFIGKIGMVVKLKHPHTPVIFEILIDGCVRHFYRDNLELIDESR